MYRIDKAKKINIRTKIIFKLKIKTISQFHGRNVKQLRGNPTHRSRIGGANANFFPNSHFSNTFDFCRVVKECLFVCCAFIIFILYTNERK